MGNQLAFPMKTSSKCRIQLGSKVLAPKLQRCYPTQLPSEVTCCMCRWHTFQNCYLGQLLIHALRGRLHPVVLIQGDVIHLSEVIQWSYREIKTHNELIAVTHGVSWQLLTTMQPAPSTPVQSCFSHLTQQV